MGKTQTLAANTYAALKVKLPHVLCAAVFHNGHNSGYLQVEEPEICYHKKRKLIPEYRKCEALRFFNCSR